MEKSNWVERRHVLRRKAEALTAKVSPPGVAPAPGEVLMHELLVHKIELEMQIEELRRGQALLEQASIAHARLHDDAPNACITVDGHGLISEANQHATALLGLERAALVNTRFSRFVSPAHRQRWEVQFLAMTENADAGRRALVLEMARLSAPSFYAYLECRCLWPAEGQPMVQCALVDIGAIRQAEAELDGHGGATGR